MATGRKNGVPAPGDLSQTPNGSDADKDTMATGNVTAAAPPAVSAAPARRKMVFRRTIVPAPFRVATAGSSTGGPGGTGAANGSRVQPVSPVSAMASRARIGPRDQPAPAASHPVLRPREKPVEPAAAPPTPVPVVKPGLSWATVAARNAGPGGTKVHVQEKPAEAPPPPPTPARCLKRQALIAGSEPRTFSNPLEEGAQTLTGFHPMEQLYMSQDDGSSSVREWALDRLERELRGFSPRYQGNIKNPRNRRPDVDEKDNCSIFICNLPLGMRVGWLLNELAAIGPFGKVYQTHVMEPSERHELPSARVCWWDRWSAERAFRAIEVGLLVIKGKTARVRWDEVRKAPHLGRTFLSRTLLIRGPAHIVDFESIHEILSDLVVYQTQKVSVLWETEEEREIRWIFGSFYAQAEPIRIALSRRWENNPNIYVRCGLDPLDVGLNRMEASAYDVDQIPDNEGKKLPRQDPDAEDEDLI